MTATKKRFGKTGGNVAYHGYQSFQTGEVTPEEAHKIGMETARHMWGESYEIVVTTHLNTDNARAYHLRRTMAEGAGTSQTPPQTDSNRKNKPVFGIGILCRLRCKNALRRR